jgi:hypothetical protein
VCADCPGRTRRICKRFRWDMGERTFWTAAEGGLAYAVTQVGNLPAWAALPLMVAGAFVKAYIARRIGHPNTASTLPPGKDPAAQHLR